MNILQLLTDNGPMSFNEILYAINQQPRPFGQYNSFTEAYSTTVTSLIRLLSEGKISKSNDSVESIYSIVRLPLLDDAD